MLVSRALQSKSGGGGKKDQNISKYWHLFTQYNMWNNTDYWLWRHGIISEPHLPHQKFSSTQKHNDLQFILSIFFSFFLLFFFRNFREFRARKIYYRLLKSKYNSVKCCHKRIFFWSILFLNKLRQTRLFLIGAPSLK